MKIPQMSALQEQSKVYSPTSGVNLSKLPNEIDDGQNADMLNMFYRNTMLRTRPGLVKEIEQTYGKIVDVCPKDGTTLLINDIHGAIYGIFIATNKAILTYDGTNLIRVPNGYANDGLGNFLPVYTDFNLTNGQLIAANKTYGTMYKGNSVYFFGSNLFLEIGIADLLYPSGVTIMAVQTLGIPSTDLSSGNIFTPYIPRTYTNCHASGSGTPLEARNYITPQVKYEYSTDGTNTVYYLLDQSLDNTTVIITYNNLAGTTLTFTFVASVTSDIEAGITATLDRSAGTVTFSTHLVDSAAALSTVPNMTVQCSKTVYTAPNPIEKCNIASWFGGTYQGQTSGDSIFVAGNPDEPNAIYHSAVGDPTYWPDDSVDYIGSPSDLITAFGKNFGKLFIFKKNSVYEKSFYWDSVSQKQSYPTSEVHVGIGCDMPNSVQLINNNLTWATSKGGVYTVATTNTNNERVIVPISQNINPDLLKNSLADLQAAVSADDGFYYYLFVGAKVYLWDYNSTAFIDYSDILKTQNRLAWYIWTTPCALTAAFLYGGKVWGASATDNFLYAFDDTKSLDEGNAWFDAYLISKAFDNGLPQFKKQPYYYVFNMACAGVVGIEIQLIDEVDTCSILETIEGGDSEVMASISLRQAMSWTKEYQVAVHRLNGDTEAWAISSYSIKSKIGKEV